MYTEVKKVHNFFVLDGPSAGLGPRAQRTLINLAHELPITTYDMRLVQELFPRTIVTDEGRVVAEGLTMEILESKQLLTAHRLEKPWKIIISFVRTLIQGEMYNLFKTDPHSGGYGSH